MEAGDKHVRAKFQRHVSLKMLKSNTQGMQEASLESCVSKFLHSLSRKLKHTCQVPQSEWQQLLFQ